MPDGKPGQIALPLTPSPFANPEGGKDGQKLNFDELVMEKLGSSFDPRLAGLCIDVMKDPDVIESILKNPAFQELSDELALEMSSSEDSDAGALLHQSDVLPIITPPSPALQSGGDFPSSQTNNFDEEILPPLVDMNEDEDSQLPPLETIEEEPTTTSFEGEDEAKLSFNTEVEAKKIAEDVVGVVCGNCHQSLPRLETNDHFFTDVSEGFVGDAVATPPPSQSMERLWKSIRSQSDLMTIVIPIVTVALMVGIMCVRPGVRRRLSEILDYSFSKLRRVLFRMGPWKQSVLRR